MGKYGEYNYRMAWNCLLIPTYVTKVGTTLGSPVWKPIKSLINLNFYSCSVVISILMNDQIKPKIVIMYKDECCGGTGTEITVPTNTVQVPITTGTVTDSGSECTGFIG